MADTKVSDMTELAETPAYDDEVPLVDSSAQTTKKVLLSNLLNFKDVDAYTDLATAVTAWNTDGSDVTLLVKSSQTLSGDLTVNSNITLLVAHEALIDGSHTLTINGPFEAGLSQCFGSSITVVFGDGSVEKVYPQWWYDGGGDWTAALNAAFAYDDVAHILVDTTYDITAKVTYSADRSTLICNGIIKAKDSSDFGSDPVVMMEADDVTAFGLQVNGNRANVTDNGSTGTQSNLLISSGKKRIKFIGGKLEQSVYCGVVFNGQDEHVVFDGMELSDIGEHGFYISGGSSKHCDFKNMEVEDFAQNATIAAGHDTHVFKVRSTAYSTNENFSFENIEISIPSGTSITTTTVFSGLDVDGVKLKNIKATGITQGSLLTTGNAKNIEYDNFVTPGSVVYNAATGNANIENIVLKNSRIADNQGYINVFKLIENVIFDGTITSNTLSTNIETKHITTLQSCSFPGDTLAAEKLDLDYGLEYPMVFRDCVLSGDVNGSTGIMEIGHHFSGTASTIKFYNCDLSGCTNTSRIVYGLFAIEELSFIDCNVGSDDIVGSGGAEILTMINCTTGASTAVTGWGTYRLRDLRGSKKSENNGTGTLLNANTSIAVAHSLILTPTIINITWRENPTNLIADWWVDTIGAANFTLNGVNPGASNLDFGWEAKVR